MSYSHVNKAKLIPCSCNTLVSSVYLPSTWANFVYPKNPRSHQTSSGVRITAGEPPDKHRSVWLDSSGLHSSWALALRSRCDPYVCWSYYEPSGNQWTETHLGAHPLVISLISLLALAIWVLSLGQWLSVQRDWSGSSYRSLINVCGWGDGSFLFPSSVLFFLFPLVTGRDVCDVSMRCTGWLTRAAGEAGWMAGWEIVTHMGVWHGPYTHTHTLTFPPFSHTHFTECIVIKVILSYHPDGFCTKRAEWKINQSMMLEKHLQHHSPQGDPAVWFNIGTCYSMNDHLERNSINQSSWKTSCQDKSYL